VTVPGEIERVESTAETVVRAAEALAERCQPVDRELVGETSEP
jgi:hypothetical protein